MPKRFADIEFVSHAFSDVKVVSRNTIVNQLCRALARHVLAKISRRMFERVFQLSAHDFENDQGVFVNVESGNLAHRDRSLGDARLGIKTCDHRDVGVTSFQLHTLNQIENRGIATAGFFCRQLFG